MMCEAVMSKQKIEPILVSIPAAAAILGRGERFIYEAIATKKIKGVKSDKRTLVVLESLKAYAAALPEAKIKARVRP
jgi:hypothetical protein